MELLDYKPGDEVHILELFETTYGKPMSKEYWDWRFLNNPEKKIMIKLMWDNAKLVGHYAVSPVTITNGNQNILSALSMTTMTHPEYSGKGIFKELAETLYKEEEKKSGLKIVWGFPNNNSHYGFIKNLAWKNVEQIPIFSIEPEKIKNSSFSSIEVTDKITEKHITTQTELTSPYLVKVNKSLNYINWRYFAHPSNKYNLFSAEKNGGAYYAITKVFPSFSEKNKFEIDILELSFPSDAELLLQLFNAVKNYYKQNNLLKFNLWLPLNDVKHIQLEKIGFTNSFPITYLGYRILDENLKTEGFSQNWFYSLGDSDIY